MEIVGKIKKIMETQNVSDKFKKREFVLSTDLNTPYPQHILFQTTQEKCAMLDNLRTNDEVKVFFNIRGREWTNQEGQVKYFVTLEAWRIDKFTPVEPASASSTSSNYTSNPPSTASPISNEVTTPNTDIQTADDDLPF
ncbi:MAG: hypothetical protein KatS3mg027_2606 [Bacteroidia bacterium]|nr:MAG: hypothetical protein KatS3mg027_2606 [Bacteroidia bacterium]